ncbi:MAG: hypothetical protein ACOX8M_13435, partial [Marvinbryantia sp.]
MYSYDDRIRAVRLYIQYDKSAAAVIRELGYPERKTLRYWNEEYLRNNGLKKKSVRSPKYSGAQKEVRGKALHGAWEMRVPDDPSPRVSEQGASEAVGHGTLPGREAS